MRRHFAQLVHKAMAIEPRLFVVTADMGYKMWDAVARDYPRRFVNVGAAEQLMIGACVGMARRGVIPIAYSITPFLLLRPFELLRTYVDHERAHIVLAGAGRGSDYEHDGVSHYAGDDTQVLQALPNVTPYWPCTNEELSENFRRALADRHPAYINLRR